MNNQSYNYCLRSHARISPSQPKIAGSDTVGEMLWLLMSAEDEDGVWPPETILVAVKPNIVIITKSGANTRSPLQLELPTINFDVAAFNLPRHFAGLHNHEDCDRHRPQRHGFSPMTRSNQEPAPPRDGPHDVNANPGPTFPTPLLRSSAAASP